MYGSFWVDLNSSSPSLGIIQALTTKIEKGRGRKRCVIKSQPAPHSSLYFLPSLIFSLISPNFTVTEVPTLIFVLSFFAFFLVFVIVPTGKLLVDLGIVISDCGRRAELFLEAIIYTWKSVNIAVAVGTSTLLRILQEAGYNCAAYVLYLKKDVSCLNTYVWCHIPTLTMLYDQSPMENGCICNWSRCAVVMCAARETTSTFYRCNRLNIAITVVG